ncbi:MAG: UDP-glucose 4-epimerase GalE [Oleispira antarctica]|nr:UDP-glucose 4-epimerase GalE [Oleispira antarctica]MBQ0792719.1 UDP-glucose 4-epimerase GalE [Oleispira antarctica]
MKILVTGGAGYIGSHTNIELIKAGFDVVVLDNLSNSKIEPLARVEKITGKPITFIEGDVRDRDCLQGIFNNHKIEAVIHFAGLKAVGESCEKPLSYYDNNVYSSIVLAQEMEKAEIKKLVFSSSATVYGDPEKLPLTEDMSLSTTNPYGASKLMVENIYRDLEAADKLNGSESPWSIALLRYFNPVGAHESGLIGEDPNGTPNNLMPYISQVAVGKLKQLSVFGGDYATVDGTGVRDYIHVVDLAKGHVKAVQAITEGLNGVNAINLGTGNGLSVLELVRTFENENGKPVPFQIVERRPGDVAACYADATKAKELLNWQAELDVHAMVKDSWHWQSKNPNGY